MQGERDSFDSSGSKTQAEKRKNQVVVDQWLLWFILVMVLVAVIGMGAIAYHQNKLVQYGNCTAVGGQYIAYDNEYKCMKEESLTNEY